MVECTKCHQPIQPGDDYFTGIDVTICLDCLDSYILERYDFCDIAAELGMVKRVAPEEPQEQPEHHIVGQIDIFGNEYGKEDAPI